MSRLMCRLSRTLGWDRNPLRRGIDRVEAVIFAALIAVFLPAAPLLATMARHAVLADTATVSRAEQGWRQVSAVVERPPASPAAELYTKFPITAVLARWTAPDGRRCSGWIEAAPGAHVGSRVLVWVDRSGMLTGPPASTMLMRGLGTGAEIGAAALLALMLYATGRAVRFLLDRRRLAVWEKAWQAVGPQWSRRR